MKPEEIFMKLSDAAYATVHDFPGGASALAPRMRDDGSMSSTVLSNKVKLENPRNQLSLFEADRLMSLTGDLRILHALADQHAHVCVPADMQAPASDMAVLELVTQVWRSNGDVGSTVADILADGKVEAHELPALREAIYRMQMALFTLLHRLEGMVQ
jgi:hypothetical protein